MEGVEQHLGRSMHMHSFSLQGTSMPHENWRHLMNELVVAIGMRPVGAPASWHYPTEDGHGGFGTTMIQPIIQSFLAVDTWPDHGAAYLIVCSCRRFDVQQIKPLLKKWRLTICGESSHVLRLPHRDEMHGLSSMAEGPTERR
jgi:S-adenosylmethionine/arginine decarboxylase-like enzyme